MKPIFLHPKGKCLKHLASSANDIAQAHLKLINSSANLRNEDQIVSRKFASNLNFKLN